MILGYLGPRNYSVSVSNKSSKRNIWEFRESFHKTIGENDKFYLTKSPERLKFKLPRRLIFTKNSNFTKPPVFRNKVSEKLLKSKLKNMKNYKIENKNYSLSLSKLGNKMPLKMK